VAAVAKAMEYAVADLGVTIAEVTVTPARLFALLRESGSPVADSLAGARAGSAPGGALGQWRSSAISGITPPGRS
jgi:hypothetical protein